MTIEQNSLPKFACGHAASPSPSSVGGRCSFPSAMPVLAQAQFRVEVVGVGLNQLPIAIAPFRGDAQSPQKIAAIVQADLRRGGQFRSVDASGAVLDKSSPGCRPLAAKSADSLATGSVTRMADGRYDVRFRLWDVVRGQDLGGQSFWSRRAICVWSPIALQISFTKSSQVSAGCSPPGSPMSLKQAHATATLGGGADSENAPVCPVQS